MAIELNCEPREKVHNERTGEDGLFVYSFRPAVHVRADGDMNPRVMPEPFEVLVDVIRGERLVRESWWTSDGLSIECADSRNYPFSINLHRP